MKSHTFKGYGQTGNPRKYIKWCKYGSGQGLEIQTVVWRGGLLCDYHVEVTVKVTPRKKVKK